LGSVRDTGPGLDEAELDRIFEARSHLMQKMQAKSLVDLVRVADKLGVSTPKPMP
jgi:FixJ family two-component response regulator